ncbi:GNAT family N-acetyltransferase [Streptomyces pactum]|uniref:GNAT family N-acetyltransferase n=1 Tax=Streptomyces pactum TaxID=68249 RepID=A0ABS0NMB2_9ACTN|nr:GNAT family N-acetyltransferase [Streptomyces pactum]MBH5336339.1 GNAT family N-acetyltransferase [Streptomyces pactum]
MTLTVLRDPQLTPALREEIVQLWTRVTNADGAVGFVPPVTPDDVRPVADAQAAAVAAGEMRMVAAYRGGALVGTAYLKFNDHRLMRHWAWVVTVMVDPGLQGGGHGRRLMREVIETGRDAGLDALRLGVRGGRGVERFYEAVGFKEIGRQPDAIRVGDGELRDDIMMWLPLK